MLVGPPIGNRTVKVALPLTSPSVTVMIVVPPAKPVTTPLVLMVATPGLLLLQTRPLVKVRPLIEPSEKYPVAAKASFVPMAMMGLVGLMTILVRNGPETAVIIISPLDEPSGLALPEISVMMATADESM